MNITNPIGIIGPFGLLAQDSEDFLMIQSNPVYIQLNPPAFELFNVSLASKLLGGTVDIIVTF